MSRPLFVNMTEYIEILKRGDEAAARQLLQRQPDLIVARNEQGTTLVALACYYGQSAIARLFAEHRPYDFWEACMLGDLTRVRECLAEGAGINEPAPDGFPPFALAVFFGQPEVYRFLLEQGADVNQPAANAMKVAAVHAAVSRGDTEGLALILDHGGDPDARQQGGWTALHGAAAQGHWAMVELLVGAGADPRAKTDKDETPADLARNAGHAELADSIGG
jgi:ankyrin repeat protein